MKNALKCFKYLLVNGYDDPNRVMLKDKRRFKPSHRKVIKSSHLKRIAKIQGYEWDCMATAIFFGNQEIMKILENRRIQTKMNSKYIEAAILSYRNSIAAKIIEELNNNNNSINEAIFVSAKNNNIKGAELLMRQINIKAKNLPKKKTPLHYAIYYNSIEMGEILISKGADINAKDIIYLNIIILFLINII